MNEYLYVVVMTKDSMQVIEYKQCISVEIKTVDNVGWFYVKHLDGNTVITNQYQTKYYNVYILGAE